MTTTHPGTTHVVTAAAGQKRERIGLMLFLVTVAWNTPVSAGNAVLLPHRLAELAPGSKVGWLAALTAASSVCGLFAGIIFGAVSDRTRTRRGAREPWLVAAAIATAVLVLPLGLVQSPILLVLNWCLVLVVVNAAIAASTAVLPDRVPVRRRATVSALVGLGLLVGNALGAVVGSFFVNNIAVGFGCTAAVYVMFTLLGLRLAPDADNRGNAVEKTDVRALLRHSFTFPRNAPDFYWALAGRLALVLGYFMINNFQLYILTDYVGLTDDRAASVVGTNSIIFLGTAVLGVLAAGPLSDRLQRRKPFVIAASLLAVVAVVPPTLSATTGALYLFSLIGGFAFGSYFGVDAALVTEVLPSSGDHGRDLGILATANTGGQVLAPLASASLISLGIGFGPVFLVSMAVCAVGAALIAPIKKVR